MINRAKNRRQFLTYLEAYLLKGQSSSPQIPPNDFTEQNPATKITEVNQFKDHIYRDHLWLQLTWMLKCGQAWEAHKQSQVRSLPQSLITDDQPMIQEGYKIKFTHSGG